jgi:hypothetical protein
MSTVPLPEQPDLGQLRKQARDLQRAVRAGDPAGLALIAEHHPAAPPAAAFPLTAAQLALARRYRFASWARLRHHVEAINQRSWMLTPPPPDESPADQFLRLVCLNFEADDPAPRREAARLLAEQPELPAQNVWVAAACADVEQVRRFLADDREAASRPGGPHGWSPLLYQAYARPDPAGDVAATLATASALLEAGADPNDGRFFRGLPTPFTVLTGVLGGGEQTQPPHPHAVEFARLLLGAGADPNDGQALYNRMFERNDDFLPPLFEFGLGLGPGGPWHRLLGDALDSPQRMVAALLGWAVTHDQRARVALLTEHGVDVVAPVSASWRPLAQTPLELALMYGNLEIAEILRAHGSIEPVLAPVASFVAAAMAGDAAAVGATPPTVIARARRRRPGLIVWAAGQGRVTSIELLINVGFDVNAFGRADTPVEQKWQSALHTAAGDGNLALTAPLLELGADPQAKDKRFDCTPLQWAQHLGQQPVIDLLAPLTTTEQL